MECSNCKNEETWLEMIGRDFICKKCINKHKIMGLVFRTKIDIFRKLIKKLAPSNYSEFMQIDRKKVDETINLKKHGIYLKTTNVVNI